MDNCHTDVCCLVMQLQVQVLQGEAGTGLQMLLVCCKCGWLLHHHPIASAKRCSEKTRGIFRRLSDVRYKKNCICDFLKSDLRRAV